MKRIRCVLVVFLLVGVRAVAQVPMDLPSGPHAMAPQLTTAPDGAVYLSWIDRTDDRAALMFSHRTKAGAWTTAETIVSGSDWFVNWADVPGVTIGEDGVMLAFWMQRLGEGRYAYGVRMALRGVDGAWSEPVWLHDDLSETEHGFVSAVWTGKAFMAAWLDGSGYGAGRNEMEVHTREIAVDGTLGPETVLDSRACDCCPTAMSRTADGTVHVAWRDRSENEIRDIVTAERTANGVWARPVVVHEDNWMIQACPVNGPALSSAGNETGMAWFTAAGNEPAVWARFATAEPVRMDAGRPSGRVAVRMLPDGRLAVLWLEGGLWLRMLDRNGGTSEAVQLAPASNDRLMVVWTDEGLSGLTVSL